MAAQTAQLARSEVGVAVLNYDDLTLLASGVTIANIGGAAPITFWIVEAGVALFRVVNPGTTANLPFTLPIAVSILGLKLTLATVSSYGIGVGVDTAQFG
jgi:hypothetical protein